MSALVIVLVGLAAGVSLRRRADLPADAPMVVNAWVLDIALPALTLRTLHDVTFPAGIALVLAAPYLLFVVTVAIYLLAARLLGLSREVVVALIATTAVANTSFVGIPMVTAFFDESWVPVALLVDQLGSYLLLTTVVLVLVTMTAGKTTTPVAMVRRALSSPAPFTLVAAILLRPVAYPAWFDSTLAALGATLTPLAMFSIGLQLRLRAVRGWLRELTLGLVVKLLVAPLVVVGVLGSAGGLGNPAVRVAMFEMAMPPMVAGAIMASRHNLATPLPSLLVGVGVPISVVTLAVWAIPLHP